MKRTTCFRKKAPKWDFHFAATYKVMSAPKASEVAAEDVNDGGAAKDVPNRFVETENSASTTGSTFQLSVTAILRYACY